MNAERARSSAKRLLLLRVMLKLMAWLALVMVIWTAFRFIFNFPEYDNRRDKTIAVQQLAVGDVLLTDWAGRELLVLKKSATEFLVIYQRSPEFSCLLELSTVGEKALLQDSCTGDLFDLNGKVLPEQRTTRNLKPLSYELKPDGALVLFN